MRMARDEKISEAFEREQGRLRSFIRARVPDTRDAEDILQDVFCEFVVAQRLARPIEHAAAWLFRVARNRIIDLLRGRRPTEPITAGDEDSAGLEDLLPSPDAGPDALYARSVMIEALEEALAELPGEQREVFLAHECDGRSFRDLAAETGVSINTLLARKHYAVRHLRRRLQSFYEDLK